MTQAKFEALLGRFTAAVFTDDGLYHDVFYGAFQGRAKIAEMLEEHFGRMARPIVGKCINP